MKRLSLILLFIALPAFAQITVTPGKPASSTGSAPSSLGASDQSTPVATPAQTVKPAATAAASASPTPTPAPKPERRPNAFGRFFRWIFGGGHKKAAPEKPATPAAEHQPGKPGAVKSNATPARTPASPMPKSKAAAPKKTSSPVGKPSPSHTPKVTATPSPTPKPAAPSPKASAKHPAKSQPSSTPAATPAPVATPAATPVATPAASPKTTHKSRSAIIATPSPAPDETATAIPAAAPSQKISAASNAESEARYRRAREQASNDPHVTALRQKLADSPEGDAYKTAAHQYIKALFGKIRTIDPNIGSAARRKEGAYIRRIDEGKPLAD